MIESRSTLDDACRRHQDDLALLAGDDLPDGVEGLHEHLGACAGCRQLLEALRSDLVGVTRIGALEHAESSTAAPLAPAILARLGTEAHQERVREQALSESSRRAGAARAPRDLRLAGFARAAVVVGVVVSSALLGLTTLDRGAADANVASEAASQGLRVARSPSGLELSWGGDGRERGAAGAVGTYRVLASADPKDFSHAKPVEVAGRHLVASVPMPASRRADRQITYFRVE